MRTSRIKSFATTGLVLVLAFTLTAPAQVAGSADTEPSFADPTAQLIVEGSSPSFTLGGLVYIAPFALGRVGSGPERGISIGDESNIQDNVRLDAINGRIEIGKEVIVAHGSSVKGPANIGVSGTCPGAASFCPSFISFNAEVDGATIQKDAIVSALARVAPGVTIPSGRAVLPGKNVASAAEVASKTVPVTEADREFMRGVIEVNIGLAREYARLASEDPTNVFGINFDPGNNVFDPQPDLPRLAGRTVRDPSFRNRLIGDIILSDDRAMIDRVMGSRISVRADEGGPFIIRRINGMRDNVIFHALEGSDVVVGNNVSYGERAVVHGGGRVVIAGDPIQDPTVIENNVTIGSQSVVFRSFVRRGSIIGNKSAVIGSELPFDTVVPDRVIVLNNQLFGAVEW